MSSQFGNSNSIVGYEALCEITGYSTQVGVIKCLVGQGIKFLQGKHGRPFTTVGALELAMGATFSHEQAFKEEKPVKLSFGKK